MTTKNTRTTKKRPRNPIGRSTIRPRRGPTPIMTKPGSPNIRSPVPFGELEPNGSTGSALPSRSFRPPRHGIFAPGKSARSSPNSAGTNTPATTPNNNPEQSRLIPPIWSETWPGENQGYEVDQEVGAHRPADFLCRPAGAAAVDWEEEENPGGQIDQSADRQNA